VTTIQQQTSDNSAFAFSASPICSYTEWDPLEEVIVGVIDGAVVPEWDLAVAATMPRSSEKLFRKRAGRAFPAEHVALAAEELEGFVRALTNTGVQVVRPDSVSHRRPFATPNWRSPGGLYSAMPRDLLLIVGETVIEAPMAWRSRYFEIDAYRRLLTEYFRRGARWVAAPKPQLLHHWYDPEYDREGPYESGRYLTLEHEPTFDAADFIRCGRDIFVQRSHVTNHLGIEWVARHLGGDYRVHTVEITDASPMHIDASFMPLAPGKLLLNPLRIRSVPPVLDSWDVRWAPQPALPPDHVLYMSSAWISMNVLMLDERRVVVEAEETPLIELLEDWGFETLRVPFRNVMRFGGSFHCVTADVRRRGSLRSYL
jgi:glycine amidinotransferase